MTETYRRYTAEEDAAILAVSHRLDGAKRTAAIWRLADEFDRTVDALYARRRLLLIREGGVIENPRNRRPFTPDEDAQILAMPMGTRAERWVALAERLGRPAISLKHRRLVLRRNRSSVRAKIATEVKSLRHRLPAATPSWFEHPITRERLMAGR